VGACPTCGESNTESARFCQSCGARLTAATAEHGEIRKTVTVLFCDVIGSTSLGERLDPESVRKVMTRYFEDARRILERHGGTVEKFIGDAVMAVFGIPAVHEDDALRAVRAALELREALDELNEELEPAFGLRIAVRTGVNTGDVVTGDPGVGQTLVIGEAVHVAARLEQSAAPGEILIGDPTWRLVRGTIEAEPVGPLELKGKAERVPAHRLLSILPRGAPVDRATGPMIGRRRELALLSDAVQAASEARRCRLVTVLGAAGVGKSRLTLEFISSLRDRPRVLRGRCLPYGEGITFWPVREVIRAAAGIADEDPPDVAKAKLEALPLGSEDPAVVVDRLASVIGLGGSEGALQETFWAVRRLFEALAGDQPLVVVFDDIHWAEPSFLDLVEYLVGWSRGSAVVVLCMARPELLELRPTWAALHPAGALLTLEPLSGEESELLMEGLLGASLSAEVRSKIVEAAEGNPLFVEQTVAMLIDDGLLRRDADGWATAGELSRISVPPTIQALLLARLDRVPAEEREVIQQASVVGKIFWWRAVFYLSPEGLRPRVAGHLQTLVRKGLIRPDPGTEGEDAFRFAHILIRDAAYLTLPKRARAELHERFAWWLEDWAADRSTEYDEILAYHLEQAARYGAELGPVDERGRELARAATERLASAGRRASARGDMSAAANLLGRAVELLPAQDPSRLALLPDMAGALMETGEFARAEKVLDEATDRAISIGARGTECHARIQGLWLRLAMRMPAEYEAARHEAEHAVGVFTELEDDLGLARAWHLLAEIHNILGEPRAQFDAALQALEHARRAGDTREQIISANVAGGAMYYGPTPADEGVRRCHELLARFEDRPSLKAGIQAVLGGFLAMQGRFDEARAAIARAVATCEELGLLFELARIRFMSGPVEMLAGDPAAAERELRAGCELFRRIGERGRLSALTAMLADALLALGRADEALRATEEAEANSGPEDVSSQASWRQVRARVLARRGRIEEAERLAREAVRMLEGTQALAWHADALRDLAEILRRAERPDQAASVLRRALRLYEQKGDVVAAERAREILERRRSTNGDR
jgi:class 3 adenylate cyclase/tetratricopeptide (TPR) repeat protein